MAVSTAAVVVLIMTAMSIVTMTVTVATTVTTVVTAAATATSQMGYQMLNLLSGGLARLKDGPLEVQRLTSQRMVQVNLHLLLANSHDMAVETAALFVLQRNDGIIIDVFVVEVAIDAEHIAIEVEHILVMILAIALFLAQRELEVLTLLCGNHLLLELVEGETKACDE